MSCKLLLERVARWAGPEAAGPVGQLTPPVTSGGASFLRVGAAATQTDPEPSTTCLKGVLAPVQQYYMTRCRTWAPQVYQCDYFALRFFPAEHFLGMARKSKPGLLLTYTGDHLLNANVGDQSAGVQQRVELARSAEMEKRLRQISNLIQARGSLRPRDWSYLRVGARKTIRAQFLQAWCKYHGPEAVLARLEGAMDSPFLDKHGRTAHKVAKDGLYHYTIRVFPDGTTAADFAAHLERSVLYTANLSWDSYSRHAGRKWISENNAQADIAALNKALHKSDIPYRYIKSST
ncbi:AAL129Cp [Eremothecium gossypii ATCC 10895]|uniref:AAL129Cp n=1 Tax=Eremothecium gossypii (strain ATCC 10895 / CBS 109.51 / FGSC 9923 / NRRL Y-1056) TaxID=284811 RepID=Q75F57_EREGS|nr:AAL129Cp [Eremothecium gossypii ATCC 10895]AAS50237.1 AAL129Cp [Eremothecium gossypii ATCC 10895]AEY94522.1 FAAL129Cp [Eremothecium gossypii FDAG1]